jgi:hypothetical protein
MTVQLLFLTRPFDAGSDTRTEIVRVRKHYLAAAHHFYRLNVAPSCEAKSLCPEPIALADVHPWDRSGMLMVKSPIEHCWTANHHRRDCASVYQYISSSRYVPKYFDTRENLYRQLP